MDDAVGAGSVLEVRTHADVPADRLERIVVLRDAAGLVETAAALRDRALQLGARVEDPERRRRIGARTRGLAGDDVAVALLQHLHLGAAEPRVGARDLALATVRLGAGWARRYDHHGQRDRDRERGPIVSTLRARHTTTPMAEHGKARLHGFLLTTQRWDLGPRHGPDRHGEQPPSVASNHAIVRPEWQARSCVRGDRLGRTLGRPLVTQRSRAA